MRCWVVLVVLVPYLNAAPSTPPYQTVSVRGHLYCGQFPMSDVKVKLIDIDPGEKDDLLDSAFTDEFGFFALTGSTREEDVMQGAIKIYHHCGDRVAMHPDFTSDFKAQKKVCTRKVKWFIPTDYNVGGKGGILRWFDIGKINMEIGFGHYERDCRH